MIASRNPAELARRIANSPAVIAARARIAERRIRITYPDGKRSSIVIDGPIAAVSNDRLAAILGASKVEDIA